MYRLPAGFARVGEIFIYVGEFAVLDPCCHEENRYSCCFTDFFDGSGRVMPQIIEAEIELPVHLGRAGRAELS
jgi:hypothetical protein